MRDLTELDKYRIEHPLFEGLTSEGKKRNGAFRVPVGRRFFLVIASVDYGDRQPVEHISVSHRNANVVPSWEEMCIIKDMFFFPDEECVQIHPKRGEYVNMVENCLHIWRPTNGVLFGRPWDAGKE